MAVVWLETPGSTRPSQQSTIDFTVDQLAGTMVAALFNDGVSEDLVYRDLGSGGGFASKYVGSTVTPNGDGGTFSIRHGLAWPRGVTILVVEGGSVSGAVSSVFGRDGDVVASHGDYSADQIVYAGDVPESSDVATALDQLQAEVTDAQNVANSHEARHEAGGADELPAENLPCGYTPSNYSVGGVTMADQLAGIDSKLAGVGGGGASVLWTVTQKQSPMAHWIIGAAPGTDTVASYNYPTLSNGANNLTRGIDNGLNRARDMRAASVYRGLNNAAFCSPNMSLSFVWRPPMLTTTPSLNAMHIMGCKKPGGAGNPWAWVIQVGANTPSLYHEDASTSGETLASTVSLEPGEIEMLTITRDNTAKLIKFYIRDVLVSSIPYIKTPLSGVSTDVFIGGNDTAATLTGVLYCVSFWNSVLSPTDVSNLYHDRVN